MIIKTAIPGIVLCLIMACQTSPPSSEHPPVSPRYQELRRHTHAPTGEDLDPEPSPDGTRIYYATSAYASTLDIYEKKTDGSTVRQLTRASSNERFPKINPTNPKSMAFCSDRNGDWDIFIIKDMDAAPEEWIRISESESQDIHPSWSPDGKYLVYCSSPSDRGEWVLKIFQTQTGKTFTLPVDGLLPEWSPVPGDTRIAFQRMRHRDNWFGAVWMMSWIDDEMKDLTEVIGSADWAAINPSWSRDGQWIAFATVAKSVKKKDILNRGDDVWVVSPQGKGLIQITSDSTSDWMPAWGPDGRIYFVSDRDGLNNIWSLKPVLPAVSGK